MKTYKIIRHFFKSNRKQTLITGLSLETAQAHCSNPETSSRTATSKTAKERTKRSGPWFDGYSEEK
jgi:hypothetical protein